MGPSKTWLRELLGAVFDILILTFSNKMSFVMCKYLLRIAKMFANCKGVTCEKSDL